MNLHTYLPQDRLRALARGETLPDRTQGSALFADISGFTPLTETLRAALGPRRGAEELTKQLDAVFAALIAAVERFGGSVIGFAGDAITCWFDETHGPAAPRATACALALQQAMDTFAEITLPNGASAALALKVTVASGPARRFAVGNPQVHYLDTLAGVTVVRNATAEHLAQKGEVLLDEVTAQALGGAVTVREWRTADTAERFAVLAQFTARRHRRTAGLARLRAGVGCRRSARLGAFAGRRAGAIWTWLLSYRISAVCRRVRALRRH